MRNVKLMSFLAILIIAAVVGAMLFAGCGQKQTEIEKFKASVNRAFEDAFNKGEVNALDKYLAADFVMHHPPQSDIKGLDAYKQAILEFRRVYPDLQITSNSYIMEGNIGASRWTLQFTDMSTGKQVKVTGCGMFQWANGKVVECWTNEDFLSMNQQLGYKISHPITENTFALVTAVQLKPENMEEALKIYKDSCVPVIKSQKGFRSIYLMSDPKKTGKMCGISIWDSEADATAALQSDGYKAYADKVKSFFKVKPVREEYTVTVQE